MRAAFGVVVYSRRKRDAVVYAAFALSLVLHALLMLGRLPLNPSTSLSSIGDPEAGKRGGNSLPLAVRLAPRAVFLSAESVTSSTSQVAHARAAHRAEAAPKGAPPPALSRRAPTALASLPPASAGRQGSGGDFLSDLAARRAAREHTEQREQSPPAGALSFGTASGSGGLSQDGGLFRVEYISRTEATISFYRINRGMQRVDVGIGANLSIQLAIVRAVIAVMRDNGFTGDVTWASQRLGRDVQISARERDATQLEAFLLLEFFSADPIRRPPDTAGTR